MAAHRDKDFVFPPSVGHAQPKIAELFVVVKLTNGSCHLVCTDELMEREILQFLQANFTNGISIEDAELPLDFAHFDGRKF
jgi:hypothetical protein